jgi:hypothetical protein
MPPPRRTPPLREEIGHVPCSAGGGLGRSARSERRGNRASRRSSSRGYEGGLQVVSWRCHMPELCQCSLCHIRPVRDVLHSRVSVSRRSRADTETGWDESVGVCAKAGFPIEAAAKAWLARHFAARGGGRGGSARAARSVAARRRFSNPRGKQMPLSSPPQATAVEVIATRRTEADCAAVAHLSAHGRRTRF